MSLADELKLQYGKPAYVIIKASSRPGGPWNSRVVPICGIIVCFLRDKRTSRLRVGEGETIGNLR
jgi:hypothetical protein